MESIEVGQKKMLDAFEKWWKNTEPLRRAVSPNLAKADAQAYFSFGWIAHFEEVADVDGSSPMLKAIGEVLDESGI